MKCLILLSLASISLGAVVPFGGVPFQHLLDPEYGYEHGVGIGTPYVHQYGIGQVQQPVHEQVVEEHPIGQVADHQVAHQVVVKDYGIGVTGTYGHPVNVHDQVVEEHPIGQVGGHHVVEQIVVKDPVAVNSHYGGFTGKYYSPYVHTQYPFEALQGIYGGYLTGHYNPLFHQTDVVGHYNPVVHHYF